MKPKATVYIPCHNYGHFLEQAIKSVIDQNFTSWELQIIDDASKDETAAIAKRYQTLYPEKIHVITNSECCGLQACANIALNHAKGDYIMRLDSDDFLDESALLVLVNYLDMHKDVALVYPNYVYVNEGGQFLALENRKKIGKEAHLLDLPAHGACTLIRKRILKSIGGYSEDYKVQDGYDLWLKVLQRYPVGNVSTPLFSYRQHNKSQTRDEENILETRSRIKRERVIGTSNSSVKPLITAIIGAKNTYHNLPNIVFSLIGGKRLIDYTIESAIEVNTFDKILVSTDDPKVKEYCSRFPELSVMIRSPELSNERVIVPEVINNAVINLEQEQGYYPDILVYLNIHAPLRRAIHIQKAIDTLLLYNTDSVLSVYEDFDLHYAHAKNGLEPLSKVRHEQLRMEREALYVDNKALFVVWRDVLSEKGIDSRKVGHIIMQRNESFHIGSPFDMWLLGKMLLEKENNDILPFLGKHRK